MSATDRLQLPFLSPGQAQKEIFHNEALQALDAVVAACVEEPARNDPPANPAAGACYIVGSAPTGAWSAQPNAIASFSGSGWRFVAAVDGLSAYVRSTGVDARFRGGAWEYGAACGAAILSPTGGTVIDSQGRTAIGQILAVLRDHRLIEN